MTSNKKGSSYELPPDTTTTQLYNNSKSSENQASEEFSARHPIVSVFSAPVNNTSNYTNLGWGGLFDKLTGPPTILQDNSSTEKAKEGAYFVRGLINDIRKDENLGKCSLIINDVDKPLDEAPLPTPKEIHVALKDITHAVHSSATPGRSRIIFLVEPYDKEQTDELTSAAYRFCKEKGLTFTFAGESKTKSQPWFLPQTSNIERHRAFGTFEGKQFSPDMVKVSQALPDQKNPKPSIKSDSHNPLRDFITALETGTIHEATKKYAGWLRRTSNLTTRQIFDQITTLIDLHCTDPDKVERWHKSEREQLEVWFVDNVALSEVEKLSPQDTPENILQDFRVTDEYVNGLGEEEWLYPDLVIAGHILVIIAMSGGGKTTFLFNEVVPLMVKEGAKVIYVDADSPVSEHKSMKASADKIGFTLINPTVNVGTGIDSLIKKLRAMVDGGIDLSGTVFIFDTLKKFTNLMNKSSVKDFFSLCRTMNSRGATCIFAAHANKYKDAEGHLIPEGVGDVKNDADDLILFEREKRNGGIDVTTVIDIDMGAKTRGLFKSFSFHIDSNREIEMFDAPLPGRGQASAPKATEEEIIDTAKRILAEVGTPISKTELVGRVHVGLEGTGAKKISNVITVNSFLKIDGVGSRGGLEYVMGDRNSQMFSSFG